MGNTFKFLDNPVSLRNMSPDQHIIIAAGDLLAKLDQIAHLSATVERLTKALEPFADRYERIKHDEDAPSHIQAPYDCYADAAQALKEARDGNS